MKDEDKDNVGKKPRYTHYDKPYELIGKIPEEGIIEIRRLFKNLSNGMPGMGGFGTSGASTGKDMVTSLDLQLEILRMEHNKGVHDLIRKLSEKYNIPWMSNLLLEKKPEDNLFIIAPDGEVWAIRW